MRLPCALAVALAMTGCATLSVYDSTKFVFDAPTQTSRVEYSSCLKFHLLAPCSNVFFAVRSDTPDSAFLTVEYIGFEYLFVKNAYAEGIEFETSPSIRGIFARIGSDTYIKELTTILIPLSNLADWSCRNDPIRMRLSGDYARDFQLSPDTIGGVLAKAKDMLDLPLPHSCLNYQ